MSENQSRRSFLKRTAIAPLALGIALPATAELKGVIVGTNDDAPAVNHAQVPLNITCPDAEGLTIDVADSPLLRGGQFYVAWRYPGAETWTQELQPYPEQDMTGGAAEFVFEVGPLQANIQLLRNARNHFTFEGQLKNVGEKPIELARLHYFHGDFADLSYRLLMPNESRAASPGETASPVKEQLEEGWRKHLVEWRRLADPLHIEPNWITSTDVSVVQRNTDSDGLLLGFTGPGTAFGEIGLGGNRPGVTTLYAGALLDNIVLEPGNDRALDRFILVYGDWQDGLKFWARQCASEFNVAQVSPPLTGYCSWYQVFAAVTPEHILTAAHDFSSWPSPPGGKTIQIDDGFQVMPGDWGPNERFKEVWDALPADIAATGAIPGLWLAPHAIYYKHPIVTEHPEWLQRLPDGSHAVSFSNWGWCEPPVPEGEPPASRPTYYLDPDHPGAREFMRDIVADAVAQGWTYLKIDFTYAVSTARVAWDRSKTYMESLRGMYQLFREAAGPDVKICACIGTMGRYALGLVDTARLGGDTTSNWDSVRVNLPGLFQRYCTNAIWWQGDPDVFHMRENPNLTTEETWLHTGTLGLLGGVFLTSDNPSQWSEEAKRRVALFFNDTGPRPPADWRVAYGEDGLPNALWVSYEAGTVPQHQIGLYNWGDSPQTVRVPLASLRLTSADVQNIAQTLPEGPAVEIEADYLLCRDQPPHSLRIAVV